MRTLFFVALSSLLTLPLFGQAPSNVLEGTWAMVSRTSVYPDSIVEHGAFPGPSYKVLNSTHFAFGRQTIIDGEVMDDVTAGGGRYILQGDTLYTEIIEYHSTAGLVGVELTFEARFEDDLWYHRGKIGDYYLEEVWRRVTDTSEDGPTFGDASH